MLIKLMALMITRISLIKTTLVAIYKILKSKLQELRKVSDIKKNF